jgi:hypothetical protein
MRSQRNRDPERDEYGNANALTCIKFRSFGYGRVHSATKRKRIG